MENSQNEDINNLIDVLSQGNAYMMELEASLNDYHAFPSETCLLLSSKLQSTFSTALTMTKLIEQRSFPRSQSYGRSFKEQERKEMCQKRKSLPRWREQVKADSDSAMEIPLDDGYSWRKYGQKDILGAKFPRCYYRCTHSQSQGCVATKQVQRSDNNSSLFDITYRGTHTCTNGCKKPSLSAYEHVIHQNLSVMENIEAVSSNEHKPECSSFLAVPWAPPESCLKHVSNVLSSSSNPENHLCFDSEIADIVCPLSSTTSSEKLGMDFGVEQFVFDSEFSFDL